MGNETTQLVPPPQITSGALPAQVWIARLVGLVLLTASLLKAYELVTGPVAESSIWTSRWLLIVVVEAEFFLGLWLLAGIYPKQSRVVALATFTLYSGIVLTKALAGERSCACFGQIEIRPWYALIFDLTLLAGLWRWRPKETSPNQRARRRLAMGGAFGLLLGLSAAILMAESGPAVLGVEPALVDFGVLDQGLSTSAKVNIFNRTDQRFVIGRLESSCRCLSLKIDAQDISPGQRVLGELLLDLAHEPGFVGGLLMKVTVFDTEEQSAVTLQAKVRVKPLYHSSRRIGP